MGKTWTYKIENGDLIEEFFVFKSTVPIHELKKIVIDNLKNINFLCDILKKAGYEASFITNQELTPCSEKISADYVLDLYDYRCLYDRRKFLFGLEYAFCDNGHILDISAELEGYRYTIYNTLGEKLYSDIYEDEDSTIYEVAQDIMLEYNMNIDSSVMLRYTNFKNVIAAKEKTEEYMPKHIKNVLADKANCVSGGGVFIPMQLDGFEKCENIHYMVLHDGSMNNEVLSAILNGRMICVDDIRVVFCPVSVEDYASTEDATRRLFQLFEINKPRFSYLVEGTGVKDLSVYTLSNALKILEDNKNYKDIVMLENLSGRPVISKKIVLNRQFDVSCEYENVFERQIFHRARLEMGYINLEV